MTRLALMPFLLAGCTLLSDSSEGPPPLLTALPRTLSAPETRLIAANNAFGLALFGAVRNSAPTENVFVSPVSAMLALGMTLNGAAGSTLDSMRHALALAELSPDETNAGFRSLIDLLLPLDPTSEFRIANSIWSDAGFPFLASFLAEAEASFDAEVRTLDLQAPASLASINDWVRQRTGGKIPTILDDIASHEVMFLINAIYFKGRWRTAFNPGKTRPAPFAAEGGDQVVPTMHLDPAPLRSGSGAEHLAVELPYGNGAFVLTIIMPGPGRTLADLLTGLDAARWAAWVGSLQEREAGLTLPRFRLEYQRELQDDLSALGMDIAFDATRADFSALVAPGTDRLYLTRVTQKTFVDVNEEGTEAAAATAAGIGVTSAPAIIGIDRPFFFVIRERLSGTIFFAGQVTRIPGA